MLSRYLTLAITLLLPIINGESPKLETRSQLATIAGSSAISAADAQKVIEAAAKKATEIGIPSNIAVTDPAGHLVAFLRMDSAVLVSIDVAQKKARTVSLFGGKFKTSDLFNGEL